MEKELLEIMNKNEEKIRSNVMNLLRQHFGIPEFDAKDILQDAWLLLLEKLATGALSEMPTKLQSYMTTVCTNKAHEYLRKVANQNAETSLDDENVTADRIDSIQKEIRSWADFIEESDRVKDHKLELLEAELKKLNARQRALIEGYYFEKRSMKELAQLLGYSSEDVAKSTKNRILNTIRATVKKQERAGGLSPAAILKDYPIGERVAIAA